MPTAAQIDKACKDGFYVFTGSRSKPQQVSGATTNYHGDVALPGNVHVYITKTGLWEEIPEKSVTITDEPFSKKETQMSSNLKIVDATKPEKPGKRSGKRADDGMHAGPPTRNTKKKDATTSLKDLGEIVGNGKSAGNGKDSAASNESLRKIAAQESGPSTAEKAPRKSSKKAAKTKESSITVSRTMPKQNQLPGVQMGKRKIQEIEDLDDIYHEKKSDLKVAQAAFKDAQANLIVSIEKHKKISYSRKTWGSVEVVGSKRIKSKREKTGPAE